jgi:hypothetical protein
MAKEKKVSVRDTPKYTTSSDDDSSDNEVDYTDLFKGLDRTKVDKINELIDALNEKYRLLEKQEDILYEEHDKFVSVQKSLALEIKRNEMLSSELSACHETVSSLKSVNDDLNAKLEEANKSSSCVEHVSICNRCKDFDVDACNEHLMSITKLNDEVASLNAQLKTCKINFDQLKFARDAYTIGRHPSIKDGLGFQKEKKMFTSYIKNKDSQDTIIFGDGNQGKVKGLGKISTTSEHSISNVFLVESLGYNLLSVSQLCHMSYNCLFTNVDVSVFRRSDGSLAFKGVLDGKLYLVDFSKEEADLDACLIAKTSMGWLWHRRLAHVGIKNLHKILKGEHVLGLTNVCFE